MADYYGVHPELGTTADLEELVAEAADRGLRILLDLVPNHTSDRHRWFLEARSSRSSPRRDWYVWADPRPDGSPPTNWKAAFGGRAWTYDERTGQYYLHNFLPEQPDLNWWNPEVRAEFDRVLRYWFDRGIAGFRIDVAHKVVKDLELADVPEGSADEGPPAHVPEVHAVLRRWRTLADGYERGRILVGETWVLDVAEMASFYGAGEDELHLAFNFPFILARFDADELSLVVEATEEALPAAAWPAWTLSNHDVVRFATRWGEGDDRKVRCALLALLTLRGTPVLYYGDELGMRETPVTDGEVRDVAGRDGCRTPMQWTGEDAAGFTTPKARPWLPLGDFRSRNVAGQREDPSSTLRLARDLLSLRREAAELRDAPYLVLDGSEGVWAWRRGESVVVALNLADREARLDGVEGVIRVATDRGRDGERAAGSLRLAPWEGVVVLAS